MRQYMNEMLGGPGSLRFFLQPAIAIALGLLHGARDAQVGREPYLLGVFRAKGRRLRQLGDGLRAIVVPLCIAVTASLLFQFIIRSRVHIVYALVYALLFVALPYFVTRGLANRLMHRRRAGTGSGLHHPEA